MNEPTLNELNKQAREIDKQLRAINEEAGNAAKAAVVEVLAEKRPDGKRVRKNLRPLPEA